LKYQSQHVGFEAHRAATMKGTAIWVVTPCGSERANHFGGTYRLHLQGQRPKFSLQSTFGGCLLGSFFGPEDGGDKFFLNVGL
jgi:hypothetical protein